MNIIDLFDYEFEIHRFEKLNDTVSMKATAYFHSRVPLISMTAVKVSVFYFASAICPTEFLFSGPLPSAASRFQISLADRTPGSQRVRSRTAIY